MHPHPCNFMPMYFWAPFQVFNNLVLDQKGICLQPPPTPTIICEMLITDNFEYLTHTVSTPKSHFFFFPP